MKKIEDLERITCSVLCRTCAVFLNAFWKKLKV